MTPVLLVLSSPSGGGKTTIARQLRATRSDVGYSVSATTRAPRAGERDGVDYFFLSRGEFERRRAAGEFAEWAEYGGNLYGTLCSELERIFGEGKHAVLDIEVVGARQLRKLYPNSVHVFILPPSAETLVARLEARRTEGVEAMAARLRLAASELDAVNDYEYVVVNEDLATAVAEVGAILDGEARRLQRQNDLAERIARMRDGVLGEAERLQAHPRMTTADAVREG